MFSNFFCGSDQTKLAALKQPGFLIRKKKFLKFTIIEINSCDILLADAKGQLIHTKIVQNMR